MSQLKKSPPVPVRPTKLIGKNGKMYAAPPVRPPVRPAPPVRKGYGIDAVVSGGTGRLTA